MIEIDVKPSNPFEIMNNSNDLVPFEKASMRKETAEVKETSSAVNTNYVNLGVCERILQTLFLPVAMFSGFGRLVILHEIKVKYLYASLAQEVLLHNLPLTLLMAYNNYMLSKKFKLDIVAFVIAGLNLIQVFIEMTYFRIHLNKGINLE